METNDFAASKLEDSFNVILDSDRLHTPTACQLKLTMEWITHWKLAERSLGDPEVHVPTKGIWGEQRNNN